MSRLSVLRNHVTFECFEKTGLARDTVLKTAVYSLCCTDFQRDIICGTFIAFSEEPTIPPLP